MFIVFEGIDGTGKSTQVKRLAQALTESYSDVVTSKEPTDGPTGKLLRDSAVTGRLSAEEELELFHVDRREHVETLIEPALERGAAVILDRYYFSTMAYQGIRGFDPVEIRKTNETFAPQPDFVFVLSLSIDQALERIDARDGEGNEFETREFLEKCDEVFRSLDDSFVHRIDASESPEKVHQAVLAILKTAGKL